MIVYFLLGLASLMTFAIEDSRLNYLAGRLLLLLFILFTGLSYTNGWDWYGYVDFYNVIQSNGFEAINGYSEFGIEYLYLIYMYAVGLTGAKFGLFIFINSVVVNILIYKFCKRVNMNYGFFMFIFLAVSYLRLELSTLRQGLAVVLIMYSYALILNSKLIKAFAFMVFAVCFHRSAAIVLLFLPFILMVNKKSIHYSIVVFAIPFIVASDKMNSMLIHFLNDFHVEYLSAYTKKLILYLSINTSASANVQAGLLLSLYFISIYLCDLKNRRQVLFLNVMACQIITSLYMIFLTQVLITRIGYYFQVGWICWVIILYEQYFRPKWLCAFLLCILFCIKTTLNFRYEADRAVFNPYYNVISSMLNDDYGRSREYILNKMNEFPQE